MSIMDKNEVLTVIEKNFDDDIFRIVNDCIIEDGTIMFQTDFPTVADEVRLEELFGVEILSCDEEDIGVDSIRYFGELRIGICVSGYQYFDREYHFISTLEEYISIRFSFCKEGKRYGHFEGVCSVFDTE